nr:ribonuclease H-like domain-containing protein [Tanacetum cinerariifolium]
YALWEVIINSDSPVPEPLAVGIVVPPKTKAQKLARKNKLKAKSTLLLAFPDEHLLKFHSIKDAKSFFEAIKIRFEGNKKSKKIHKTILKQQYENFVSSRSKGLDKTYDSINVTVNAAHDIPTIGLKEQPFASSYVDDVIFSFFASQSNTSQLDNEDLEQIDTVDLKRWISNGRGHFAREFHAPRNQGNKSGDNEKRVVLVETPTSSLVVQDGLGGYDRSYQAEEGPIDFALLAHSSDSANSSNSEVQSCSNKCLMSKIDEDNNQAKDRYKVGIGYHAVPPPYIGNYMPQRADLSFTGLDDSVFKFKISETRTSVNENESIASKCSEEIR